MPKIYLLNILPVLFILLPNFLFFRYPPNNIIQGRKMPRLWIFVIIFENIGRFGVFLSPLFFTLQRSPWRIPSVIIMAICLILYYRCWLRYFMRGREYKYLFLPLGPIPLPMALMPCLIFIAFGLFLDSLVYWIFTVIFTVAHLSESYRNYSSL